MTLPYKPSAGKSFMTRSHRCPVRTGLSGSGLGWLRYFGVKGAEGAFRDNSRDSLRSGLKICQDRLASNLRMRCSSRAASFLAFSIIRVS